MKSKMMMLFLFLMFISCYSMLPVSTYFKGNLEQYDNYKRFQPQLHFLHQYNATPKDLQQNQYRGSTIENQEKLDNERRDATPPIEFNQQVLEKMVINKYKIVVDAGSTGCKLNLFEMIEDKNGVLPKLITQNVKNKEYERFLNIQGITPKDKDKDTADPIAGDRPTNLKTAKTLVNIGKSAIQYDLMTKLKLSVPKTPYELLTNQVFQKVKWDSLYKHIPIYIAATGGVRKLIQGSKKNEEIVIQSIEHVLYYSGFKFEKGNMVTVEAGNSEAINAWLAINLIYDNFRKCWNGEKLTARSVSDYGGSTLQIAVEVDKKTALEHPTDMVMVNVSECEYYVYAKSFQDFGKRQAFNLVTERFLNQGTLKEINEEEEKTKIHNHPCLPKDVQTYCETREDKCMYGSGKKTLTKDGVALEDYANIKVFDGSGDKGVCKSLIQEVIREQIGEIPEEVKKQIKNVKDFVLMQNWGYIRLTDSDVADLNWGKVQTNLQALKTQSEHLLDVYNFERLVLDSCGNQHGTIKKDKDGKEIAQFDRITKYPFLSLFGLTLLEALGFDSESKEASNTTFTFAVTLKIGEKDVSLDWTPGFIYVKVNDKVNIIAVADHKARMNEIGNDYLKKFYNNLEGTEVDRSNIIQ